MTTIAFVVRVELDDDVVAAIAARRHTPAPAALDEVIADVELRLNDAARHLDGVTSVRVELSDPSMLPARSAS